jgi:hypothetical protein
MIDYDHPEDGCDVQHRYLVSHEDETWTAGLGVQLDETPELDDAFWSRLVLIHPQRSPL